MSDFNFVTDKTLLSNIDLANEFILELFLLTKSEDYQDKRSIISSLRKTIIIYTATIVEALLLWRLKQKCHTGVVILSDEWEYKEPHKIADQENGSEIVWIRREKVKKKLSMIDFAHLIKICAEKSIIRGAKLISDIDNVRKLRNNLHIGGLTNVDREYTETDLALCFSTLERVKKLLSKNHV